MTHINILRNVIAESL